MTEKDYEIQNLRRENALLKKSRDLFKDQFYTEVRKNEKLKTERDAAIADLREFSYCCNCESYSKDGKYTGVCKRNGEIYVWNHTCMLWEWRGANG